MVRQRIDLTIDVNLDKAQSYLKITNHMTNYRSINNVDENSTNKEFQRSLYNVNQHQLMQIEKAGE
jgi:hypothetical protein